MPILVICPKCQARLKAPDAAAGKALKCVKCTAPVHVPGAQPAEIGPKRLDPNRVYTEAELEVLEEAPATPKPAQPLQAPAGPPGGLDEWVARLEPPAEMVEDIRAELTKGERVVWMGHPDKELLLAEAQMAVYFAPVLFVVALGLLIGAVFMPLPGEVGTVLGLFLRAFMALVGLVFAGGGVVCLMAKKLLERFPKGHAYYVLTNRRAIIFQPMRPGGRRLCRAYNGQQLTDMKREESKKFPGAGDLIFEVEIEYSGGASPGMGRSGGRGSSHERETKHGFLKVAKVRDVEKLVRETLLDRPADKLVAR
jgi:hypothetical protein